MSLLKNRDSYLENLLVKGNYDKAMDYICDFSKEDVFSRLSTFA